MNQVKDFFQWLLDVIKIFIIIQPWQTGIIVRNGKKIRKISKGIFFRLPYFDSVFVQENRLRVSNMAIQTLTTKDLNTITLNSSCGYSIIDIEKLYNTLYHPEITIANMCMSEVAEFVFEKNLKDITPKAIEDQVLIKLKQLDYGICFEYFRLSNFAVVKTFRLIQDQSWVSEGLQMNEKK